MEGGIKKNAEAKNQIQKFALREARFLDEADKQTATVVSLTANKEDIAVAPLEKPGKVNAHKQRAFDVFRSRHDTPRSVVKCGPAVRARLVLWLSTRSQNGNTDLQTR